MLPNIEMFAILLNSVDMLDCSVRIMSGKIAQKGKNSIRKAEKTIKSASLKHFAIVFSDLCCILSCHKKITGMVFHA